MNFKDKDWLYQKYIVEELSIKDIAKLENTGRAQIKCYIDKYDIQMRNKSEAIFADKNPMFGKHHSAISIEKIKLSSIKYSNDEFLKLVKLKGFTLLSKYEGENYPATAKCDNCNEVICVKNAKSLIKRKNSFCKRCVYDKSLKYTLESVKNICATKNIKIINNTFSKSTDYYDFECEKFHFFKAQFCELLKSFNKYNSNGCNLCRIEKSKTSIDEVKRICLFKNLEILSEYKGCNEDIFVKCNICNLERHTSLNSIIQTKRGCPRCSGVERVSQEIFIERLSKFNKECIEYLGLNKPAKIKCLKCNRVKIYATAQGALYFNNCKYCILINQTIVGNLLKDLLPNTINIISNFKIKEKIFDDNKFIIRSKIFVDFYFELNNKKYIVEYNGKQHYEPIIFTNMTQDSAKENLRKQIIRDEWLRNYCINNNIKLIEISYKINTKNIEKLLSNIIAV